MGETLVNISADTAKAFMEGVTKSVGAGPGIMGDTTYKISSKYSLSEGTVSKVVFTLNVDIRRAHWSEGKPDALNKKAILAAEELNKKHELKHKKLAEDILKREAAKFQKKLEGKTENEVEDAIVDLRAIVDAAFEELDGKEGKTMVTANANGSFTVKQVAQ